ncbi:MAG TPA: polysaccharide deacetylase family protein, partial [Gemmatimonadaceae bacterium]|nr:polysaccharide deacetylase family protein [Gemmatimonadaceae bacterium]
MRRGALVAGVITTLLALACIVSILVPPLVPHLPMAATSFTHRPELAVTRRERRRLAKRMQLWFALRENQPPPATRARAHPLAPAVLTHPRHASGDPIVAGFYVNWDDNSRAALVEHADDMDWVVCEWGFVARGGDSLRLGIDQHVPIILSRLPESSRPQLFLMVENYDSASKRWDSAALRHLLTTPAARATAIRQLTDSVVRYGLGGVTLDFEEVPLALTTSLVRFERTLHDTLAARGRLLTQAISINDDDRQLARYAAVNDKLFLMLYDEHYGGGDPGPVASETWFAQKARAMLRVVPPAKAILTLGAYGYDWNDGDSASNGAGMTFQEVMAAVREAPKGALHFDPVARNPYATWSDPDSTDHVAWYLDAVTAYNEMLIARALGAAGTGIWRLGSEDPAIWSVVGRHGLDAPPQELASIPAGYDPEFQGNGEILEMLARPTSGHRDLRIDPRTHLVIDEHVTQYATPYIMRLVGSSDPHRIALTFDDGPDGRWTPAILDTLRSRHAPATFFVIGQNAEAHIPLIHRMYAEGHELGSHTFTHPNLALTSKFVTRLELDATQRLLEAVLDRRPAFFRPPYFGDAEPTTADELIPVGIASDRGYLTVGLHIDSEDWTQPGVRTIIDTTLEQLPRGNVILLHDGGGYRAQTVAALGPLIDSLRARGDTLVLVSELMGVSRADAMPALAARSALARAVELASFGSVGVLEWVLYW